MEKYYLIPMTDRDIYIDDKSLCSILKESHPILMDREEERIDILYSTSPLVRMPITEEIRYKKHKEETKKMYHELQVPEYIIAYGNECEAREILTNAEIISRYLAALSIRGVTKEKAKEYYYINNYYEKIVNYFNNLSIINETPFIDDYDFEGYIEGEIEGKDIKGNFKGKIKIKKIN